MKYTVTEFRKNIREILDAVDQGADVQIQRYDRLYSINPSTTGTFVVDKEFSAAAMPDGEPKLELPVRSTTVVSLKTKQAQKRIDVATEKIAEKGLKRLKNLPPGVSPVDSCPHGYAKGFCKKAECNKKYAK